MMEDRIQENILTEILVDREQRYAIRQLMASKGYASLSLNFNIPGYPKTDKIINKVFQFVSDDFKCFLVANRIPVEDSLTEKISSTGGDFFIQAINPNFKNLLYIKECLEKFEQEHYLGRLLDADLFSEEAIPISSGKQKKCFFCGQAAKQCIKERTHKLSELRNYAVDKLYSYFEKYQQKYYTDRIAALAVKSILFEVSTPKKPGLICPNSNGAHRDMDYFTFLSSSATLSSYFHEIVKYGYVFSPSKRDGYAEVKTNLRIIGLKMEKHMLEQTNGANTQKGIIFLLGLACFAAGYVFSRKKIFSESFFRTVIKEISNGIVASDLKNNWNKGTSHGEKCFLKYGEELAVGARGEAENGFSSVFDVGIKFLREKITNFKIEPNKKEWEPILQELLLLFISKNNDTNILYRRGEKVLNEMKEKAEETFYSTDAEKKVKLERMMLYCEQQNISPGGSADLLALTLFIYFLENLK